MLKISDLPENKQYNFIELMLKFRNLAYENSKAKGFWDEGERIVIADGCMGEQQVKVKTKPANIPEKIALMHSELSEALEAYRHKNPPDKHCPNHCSVSIELADCVIRILDLCGHLGIDLGEAIIEKMKYNETREHMHGGKTC